MAPENLIRNNKTKSRFEIKLDKGAAYLDYKWTRDKLVLLHTFVPVAARGQGLSIELVKFVLDYALKENTKLIVYCPVVAAYLKTLKKYNSIVEKIKVKK